MIHTKWKDLAELIGIAAIVASLIFVGLELRQTRSIALAATYQARTDSELLMTSILNSADIQAAFSKERKKEPLTPDDVWVINGSHTTRFMYLENVHYQFEVGMLSSEAWSAHLSGHVSGFVTNSNFREWWEGNRNIWRPTFAEAVDDFLGVYESEDKPVENLN